MKKNMRMSQSLTDSRFSGWGWSMIFFCMIIYFLYAALTTDVQNLLPDAFAAHYGLDAHVLLAYATPASIVGIIGGFIFSRMLLKISTRIVGALTLLVSGAAFALWGLCSTVLLYVLFLVMVCFFVSAFGFVAPTIMTDWFPRKKGVALGWATIGAPCSCAFFIPAFSAMLEQIGFKVAFVIVGVAIMIVGAISLVWVKETPERVGRYPDNMEPQLAEKLGADLQIETDDTEKITVRDVLKKRNAWLISIGFGLIWMVMVGVASQFVPRMMSVGYTHTQALHFLTITSMVGIPGSYLWGWIDGKVGPKIATIAYAANFALAMLFLNIGSNIVIVWVGCVMVGLGLGGVLNRIPSLIITYFGKAGFKQANSVITTISSFIRVLAFGIMAFLLTISQGNYTLPYTVFIVAEVVGIILLLLLKKRTE
ncbi:MAG: MFS transporter [Eubacterium sp.]|nr:MFS transporter [Eubacterium sp.]